MTEPRSHVPMLHHLDPRMPCPACLRALRRPPPWTYSREAPTPPPSVPGHSVLCLVAAAGHELCGYRRDAMVKTTSRSPPQPRVTQDESSVHLYLWLLTSRPSRFSPSTTIVKYYYITLVRKPLPSTF
ncbi:hypothetical protein VPH35_022784 [Triticum aestivum]